MKQKFKLHFTTTMSLTDITPLSTPVMFYMSGVKSDALKNVLQAKHGKGLTHLSHSNTKEVLQNNLFLPVCVLLTRNIQNSEIGSMYFRNDLP